MADSKSKRERDQAEQERQEQREKDREAKAAGQQVPDPTVVQEHPELDPNEPGIDEVERNRRREELARRQG